MKVPLSKLKTSCLYSRLGVLRNLNQKDVKMNRPPPVLAVLAVADFRCGGPRNVMIPCMVPSQSRSQQQAMIVFNVTPTKYELHDSCMDSWF